MSVLTVGKLFRDYRPESLERPMKQLSQRELDTRHKRQVAGCVGGRPVHEQLAGGRLARGGSCSAAAALSPKVNLFIMIRRRHCVRACGREREPDTSEP